MPNHIEIPLDELLIHHLILGITIGFRMIKTYNYEYITHQEHESIIKKLWLLEWYDEKMLNQPLWLLSWLHQLQQPQESENNNIACRCVLTGIIWGMYIANEQICAVLFAVLHPSWMFYIFEKLLPYIPPELIGWLYQMPLTDLTFLPPPDVIQWFYVRAIEYNPLFKWIIENNEIDIWSIYLFFHKNYIFYYFPEMVSHEVITKLSIKNLSLIKKGTTWKRLEELTQEYIDRSDS